MIATIAEIVAVDSSCAIPFEPSMYDRHKIQPVTLVLRKIHIFARIEFRGRQTKYICQYPLCQCRCFLFRVNSCKRLPDVSINRMHRYKCKNKKQTEYDKR